MMRFLLIGVILSFILSSFSYAKNGKIKYRYKKYERFDFDALDVEGTNNSPGDLSISPRFKKKFKNKIPLRKNFNQQMKKAVDSVL